MAILDPDQDDALKRLLSRDFGPRTAGSNDEGSPTQAGLGDLEPRDPGLMAGDVSRGTPTAFETDKTPQKNDADSEKIESSSPGLQPDELERFLQSQESQMNKWGPDKEAAVMQNIQEGYRKPGYLVSEGLAGLGDAIMQGVARAGPGGALNAVQRNKENAIKNTADTIGRLQEGNLKQMAMKQGLERMRPGSAINKAATPVLEATLRSMGIPDSQIPLYLSNPEEARKAIDVLKEVIPAKDKIKLENELKLMELRLQEMNLSATHGERKTQQDIERQGKKLTAAEGLQRRPWYQKIAEAPFVPLPKSVATKEMEKVLEGEEIPTINSEEEYKALPKGASYRTASGKSKVKS